MSMNDWNDAKAALRRAKEFVGMVGKPQKTSREAVGKLHFVSVESTIHFQPTDGANNYHECKEFDLALSRVIQRHWTALSAEVLADLEREVASTGKAARASVQSMLDQIDAYEAP